MTWQPISTAPRDVWIIVTDGLRVTPACWEARPDDENHIGWCGAGSSFGGVLYDLHNRLEFEPTAWQPLPEPPQSPTQHRERGE